MRVGHFVEYDKPISLQECVDVGLATWRWNKRGHGDDFDLYILVNGRFRWDHSKDESLVFVEETINGSVYHQMDDLPLEMSTVDKYFLNGDG